MIRILQLIVWNIYVYTSPYSTISYILPHTIPLRSFKGLQPIAANLGTSGSAIATAPRPALAAAAAAMEATYDSRSHLPYVCDCVVNGTRAR